MLNRYVNQKMKEELDKELDKEEAALEQRLINDGLLNDVHDTLDPGTPSRGSSMRRSRSTSDMAGMRETANSDTSVTIP